MALDERTRHELHNRFAELLGDEHAAAAMSAYPPAGDELATRADLQDLRRELEVLEHRLLAALHEGLNSQTKTLVFSTIGSIAAMLGGAVAISNLFG